MKLKEIKELLDLAKKQKINSLDYEDKDFKLKVDFGLSKPMSDHPVYIANNPMGSMLAPMNHSSEQSTISKKEEVVSAVASKKEENKSAGHKILSPLVGTFYASPTPSEPVFVKVGDRVKKGQVLGIVEAMKIMNEVESDVDGEIKSIHVENESLVEYGQAMFTIKI
jgi:acetyl-CoA carboxylase biotin carboxyl carrier protein